MSDSVSPCTMACQAPLSMGFLRQQCWSGMPFPSPRDFPDPGIEHWSLASPAWAGGFFTTYATWEALRTRPKTVPHLWAHLGEGSGSLDESWKEWTHRGALDCVDVWDGPTAWKGGQENVKGLQVSEGVKSLRWHSWQVKSVGEFRFLLYSLEFLRDDQQRIRAQGAQTEDKLAGEVSVADEWCSIVYVQIFTNHLI